jgi:hypothetical protein
MGPLLWRESGVVALVNHPYSPILFANCRVITFAVNASCYTQTDLVKIPETETVLSTYK